VHFKADYRGFTSFNASKTYSCRRLTPIIANSPVAVIVTHDKIIDGHDGIFLPGFLAPYIAFIEGKRAVLRYQRFEELTKVGESGSAPVNTLCAL
jgi:hypothetical protein